jgi:lipopolysaccharide biosynthesis regulator YciM
MRSKWIAILFALFFLIVLIDSFRRVNAPLWNPQLFQLESKLIYIILSSAGLGALLLFLLVAFFPPKSMNDSNLESSVPSTKRTRKIAQLQIAMQLRDQTRIDELLSTVEETDPDFWQAKKIQGDLYAEKGEWSSASKAYRSALQQSAGQEQALLQLCLGNVYEQQDELDGAKDLYLQAFKNAPRSDEIVERLRNLAVRERDWKDAMTWQEYREQFQDEEKENPQELNWKLGIRLELAREAAASGNVKTAHALLKYIFRWTAYFTPAYLLQGEIQARQQSPLAAVKIYEQGFHKTQNPIILKKIGESFLLENQPQRAIDFLREIVRNHASDPRVNFCLGDLFRKLEMTAEARKAFESVRQKHPDWLLNNVALAEIYDREGEKEKATELYKGIIDNSEALSTQPWQCYNCNTTYPEYVDLCIVCFQWNSVNLNQNKAGTMDFGHEKSTALPL